MQSWVGILHSFPFIFISFYFSFFFFLWLIFKFDGFYNFLLHRKNTIISKTIFRKIAKISKIMWIGKEDERRGQFQWIWIIKIDRGGSERGDYGKLLKKIGEWTKTFSCERGWWGVRGEAVKMISIRIRNPEKFVIVIIVINLDGELNHSIECARILPKNISCRLWWQIKDSRWTNKWMMDGKRWAVGNHTIEQTNTNFRINNSI